MIITGVIEAVASFHRHSRQAARGVIVRYFAPFRKARLVLALWLAADQELCCEGLSIRRLGRHI